jgi:hypothetical protein
MGDTSREFLQSFLDQAERRAANAHRQLLQICALAAGVRIDGYGLRPSAP